MAIEDSALLRFVTDELNARIRAGEDMPGRDELEDALIDGLGVARELRPDLVADVESGARMRVSSRRQSDKLAARKTKAKIGAALNIYETLLAMSEEANQRILHAVTSREEFWEFDQEPDRIFMPRHVVKTLLLLSLQARGIIVASEVLQLVKCSMYSGAYARVRTLYEITVIAAALASGGDQDLCDRYHATGILEHLRDLRTKQRSHEFFGWPPPTIEEINECEEWAAKVIAKYGSELRQPHGWAKPLFPAANQRVTFADLDRRFAGQEMRAIYEFMNHHIHAGSLQSTYHVDFEKHHLVSTRNPFSRGRASFALRASGMLLDALNYTVCRELSWDNEVYDELLIIEPIRKCRVKLDAALPST
ncbi:DUF5677 domain-containing protein [Micromonospora maris]|uniref:DUF5677 domain-containing protein n=1 Tax=Micromonospora maris TaxID=1003110 RepID=UPI002E1462AF|nr:DUF5677 domain-containing protein [Micromonospora maris]